MGTILKVACDTFCLDMDETFNEASQVLQNEKLTTSTVRFVNTKPDPLNTGIYLTNHLKINFILS